MADEKRDTEILIRWDAMMSGATENGDPAVHIAMKHGLDAQCLAEVLGGDEVGAAARKVNSRWVVQIPIGQMEAAGFSGKHPWSDLPATAKTRIYLGGHDNTDTGAMWHVVRVDRETLSEINREYDKAIDRGNKAFDREIRTTLEESRPLQADDEQFVELTNKARTAPQANGKSATPDAGETHNAETPHAPQEPTAHPPEAAGSKPAPKAATPMTESSATMDASATANSPITKGQSPDHAMVANHRFSGGANVGAAVVDTVNIGRAIAEGDTKAAVASGGSLLTNTVSAGDNLLATAGKTSGNVSKVLGKVGIAGTIATSGVELYKIQAEDGIDKKQKQTEVVTTAAAGFGGAVGGTAVVGTVAAAAGATGFVAGTIATGGGLLVAAAAAGAVAGVNHLADKAMYGAEDNRFQANLDAKQNMVGLAGGKFRDQLADPKTGEINWKDTETLNKYAGLLTREEEKQTQIMKDNSSYVSRWFRSDESVIKQESARSDLHIAQSAKKELGQHFNDLARAEQTQESREPPMDKAMQTAAKERQVGKQTGIAGGAEHSEAKAVAPSQIGCTEARQQTTEIAMR